MNLPGPPWLAIEKYPEDYYNPSLLGVPLKMPDMMTHKELVKIVEHLAGISPESDNYFSFFSKDVIERNVEVRSVNEEEERRAGEEIHAGVDADEMMIDLLNSWQMAQRPDISSNNPSSPMVVDTVTSAEVPCTLSNDLSLVMINATAATATAADSSSPMIVDAATPAEISSTLSNELSLVMASTTAATVTADTSSPLMVVDPVAQEPQPSFTNNSSSVVIDTTTAQNTFTPATMPSTHTINSDATEDIHSLSIDDLAWANFERWVVNDLNGGEGRGVEITMSDVNEVNVREGIDANLSDVWLDLLLSDQQTGLSSASLASETSSSISYESSPSVPHARQQSLSFAPHEQQQSLPFIPHEQQQSLLFIPHKQQQSLPSIPHEQQQSLSFIPHKQQQSLPSIIYEQFNQSIPHDQLIQLLPSVPDKQTTSHSSSASLSDLSLPGSHDHLLRDHVALPENQLKDGPKKLPFFKIVDDIPVRKNGSPCAAWKGYAVLDQAENT